MAKKTKKPEDKKPLEVSEDRLTSLDDSEEQVVEEVINMGEGSDEVEQAESADEADAEVDDEQELSADDLLADVRQSLVAEGQVVKKQSFVDRVTGRFKKKTKKTIKAKSENGVARLFSHIDIPSIEVGTDLSSRSSEEKKEPLLEEQEAIQEFFSDLEALAKADEITDVDLSTSLQRAKDVEKLRGSEKPTEDPMDEIRERLKVIREKPVDGTDEIEIREIALEEYDETPLQPTSKGKVSLGEMLRTTIRGMKLFEKILLAGVFVLVVGMMVGVGGYLIYSSIPAPTPMPTLEPSDVPIPTQLSLPGGWEFNLRRGRVVDGVWNPQGAEWLDGTEISRWVALPYSVQLEAVLRTLQAGDEVTLTMDNFDKLIYRVESREKMTLEKLLALDDSTPSLLIILAQGEEEDPDVKWVIRAVP